MAGAPWFALALAGCGRIGFASTDNVVSDLRVFGNGTSSNDGSSGFLLERWAVRVHRDCSR